MDNDFILLRNYISKFITLSDADWQLLEPHLKHHKIKKHGFFEREGQVGRNLGYIIDGNMRHFYTHQGEEKTTYFYFENSMLGSYFSCITGQPSKVTFEALTDVKMIVFPYAVLKSLFDKSHAWERFGRLLVEYLAMGLEDRMVGLLTLSPEERYIQLLESNKRKITERIAQHYIANYLGITPVSLSRIRNRVLTLRR
jgi:CRP-like cAMP-binding protein